MSRLTYPATRYPYTVTNHQITSMTQPAMSGFKDSPNGNIAQLPAPSFPVPGHNLNITSIDYQDTPIQKIGSGTYSLLRSWSRNTNHPLFLSCRGFRSV